MGHDITVYRIDDKARDTIYKGLGLDLNIDDDTWLDRYHAYEAVTQVAYLCRSAGNPLNIIIYQVLGCEHVYAGCSGCGDAVAVPVSKIEEALAKLDELEKNQVPVERERNMGDDVMETLSQAFGSGNDRMARVEVEIDLEPERRFLKDALNWAAEQNVNSVTIHFG